MLGVVLREPCNIYEKTHTCGKLCKYGLRDADEKASGGRTDYSGK